MAEARIGFLERGKPALSPPSTGSRENGKLPQQDP